MHTKHLFFSFMFAIVSINSVIICPPPANTHTTTIAQEIAINIKLKEDCTQLKATKKQLEEKVTQLKAKNKQLKALFAEMIIFSAEIAAHNEQQQSIQ